MISHFHEFAFVLVVQIQRLTPNTKLNKINPTGMLILVYTISAIYPGIYKNLYSESWKLRDAHFTIVSAIYCSMFHVSDPRNTNCLAVASCLMKIDLRNKITFY